MIKNMTHTRSVLTLAGLVALVALWLVAAGSARADFGVQDLTVTLSDPVHDAAGATATQAGGHPDLTVYYQLNAHPDPLNPVYGVPEGDQRNVDVALPRGLYGDPTAVPTCSRRDIIVGSGTNCALDTRVGTLTLQLGMNPAVAASIALYNVAPGPGEAAAFAANLLGVTVNLVSTVGPDGTVHTSLRNVNQGIGVVGATLTLWGVPGDPSHDADRGGPSGAGRHALLTTPSDCSTPMTFTLKADAWQGGSGQATATLPAPAGCDGLAISHHLVAQPTDRRVDTPSGYDVELRVDQNDAPSALATPPVRHVSVNLPNGVALSPPAAEGLEGCSDAQLGLGSDTDATCPAASKVGSVTIKTPLLPDDLTGNVYLGSPTADAMFRLFMVIKGPGVLLKIPGTVHPDSATGQLTASFDDLPPLPFSVFHMHLKGGPNATLANPQTCGQKVATSDLSAWGGATSSDDDSFTISADGNGAACPATAPFNPSFEAGTLDPTAGGFSPFTMTIRRNDGDQEFSKIAVSLPPGLLGILSGIPQCPEAQAAAGSCDASTQVGTTTVESGSGSNPLPLTGKVFLAGPYKGAPYSLAIVVRAVAGPFDLGTVVVRAPLNIDASGGKVSVPADSLPTILQGVPLRLRTINVTLDRPGFMFNATNCTTMSVGATLTSVAGAVATPSSRYQAIGCAALPVNPDFSLRLTERKQMKKGGHPGVLANLSQKSGQSGLKRVEVTLPSGVSVDLKNLGSICKAADAAARKCADTAIVGQASAKTPALPTEFAGPVYLVEGTKTDPKTGKQVATLPRLWLKLASGGVPLDLWGDTNVVNGRVITTFPTIPDAPISSFQLQINGGPKGILMTNREMCSASRASRVTFVGQNGMVVPRSIRAAGDCAPRIAKTKVRGSMVSLTVSGIGPGRLTVDGSSVGKSTRSLMRSDVATITATLTESARRQLADGSVRVRLTVTYTPSGGGTPVTLTKTVTIRS